MRTFDKRRQTHFLTGLRRVIDLNDGNRLSARFTLRYLLFGNGIQGILHQRTGVDHIERLPCRQVNMTSSRLNAHLSFPTSKRLTVITCGAANATPEVASRSAGRSIFSFVMPVHQKGSRVANRLTIARTMPPTPHSICVILTNHRSVRGFSCRIRGTRTYRFVSAIATISTTSAHFNKSNCP